MNTAIRALITALTLVIDLTNLTVVRAQTLSAVMGGYWFPNPGTGGSPDFDQQFDQFTAVLGAAPHFRNMYGDNSNNLSNIAGSQWWNVSPLKNDPRFANGAVTPVIGLAMAASEDLGNASAILGRFNAIAAGTYDSQWQGVVDAWQSGGFKTIVVRLGYEMNGNWMAWAVPGGSKVAAWNAAFRHVARVMKAEGAKYGVQVLIAWNPCVVIWSDVSTPSQYPGDDVVDIISLDIYSSVQWAADLTNWNSDGTPGSTAPNVTAWASNVINRRHFWMYPDGTASDPSGANQYGWGLAKHLAFAAARKKPIAISESGVGINPGGPIDAVDDDGVFPTFLWGKIHNYAYGINHVVIWTLDASDCSCDILIPTNDPHPLAAAAWRKHFGSGR